MTLLSVIDIFVGILTAWILYKTLEMISTPQIECYLRPRDSNPAVFELVVANFGKGAAKDVRIELVDVDEESFSNRHVMLSWREKGPFALIGPGETRTDIFGFSPNLLGEGADDNKEPLKSFRVVSTYRWTPLWKKYLPFGVGASVPISDSHEMDIQSFNNMVFEQSKDKIAEEVKKGFAKLTKEIEKRPRPPIPPSVRELDKETFRLLDGMMPELFAEMRTDLEKRPFCREFIVLHKGWIYNGDPDRPILSYYHEDHESLSPKAVILANSGAVTDVKFNDVERYLMSEKLVEYLTGREYS